ncbi:MAG TPA: methylmalonyl-CoA mutase, partial [Anaerolineales bacterium]|nr:methylmalonyl-CoA mutase [Anaerolineales bacterium]
YRYQQAVERGEQIVVGMNAFQAEENLGSLDRLRVDPAIEAEQRTRLAALRARRDASKARELLAHLESAARGDENLLPLFIECVENSLTLGEITGVLRSVWGEYEPANWV